MDKKFKVLQFPIANAKGGVTQYALNNWQYINKDKFQFDFATLSKKLDFADDLAAQGCKIHYISCYAEENKSQFVTEVDKALSEGYDAVHIHTSYWKSFLVEELAVKHKIPKIIVHSHSTMVDILDDNKRASAVELHERQKKNFSADLATHFCACSQAAADWLFGEQIPKDKIKILNNAINVDDFSYNPIIRKEYRRKLGVDNCFVLGNIGRFVYQKNHDFLIDVFNEAAAAIPNAKLLLVGA
ncbi:MAG TPA: hypothetical protein DCP97_00290, partial [Ruminococcaceae bacterium]|nr:hypothetical protein [Oscillospiraceae bacterium]